MSRLKILTIFGTRPEAIKMAPVIRQLQAKPTQFDVHICVTAQHRQMLDQVLNLFDIQPDIDLNIMKPDQSLADLTAMISARLDKVIRDIGPDWVLAQGDTTTVMVAAILAFYKRSRFSHVEAGLRTGDTWQPFPEEINRRVAGIVADLHFAPTEWSKQNLLRENVLREKRIVLMTAHRRENFVSMASLLLDSREEHQRMARAANAYGDGHAAERIVKALEAT